MIDITGPLIRALDHAQAIIHLMALTAMQRRIYGTAGAGSEMEFYS